VCSLCWAYTVHSFCTQILSLRIQLVLVCSVYVYKFHVYAQHTCIFEKRECQGKVLFHKEYPAHIALNGDKKKTREKNLMLGHWGHWCICNRVLDAFLTSQYMIRLFVLTTFLFWVIRWKSFHEKRCEPRSSATSKTRQARHVLFGAFFPNPGSETNQNNRCNCRLRNAFT